MKRFLFLLILSFSLQASTISKLLLNGEIQLTNSLGNTDFSFELVQSKYFDSGWYTKERIEKGGLSINGLQESNGLYYVEKNYAIVVEDTTQKELEDAKIAKSKNAMALGYDVIAIIGARNRDKNLTVEQVQTQLSAYSPIVLMLQNGALDSAISTITGMTPDGTIFTQADKDAILLKLSEYEP